MIENNGIKLGPLTDKVLALLFNWRNDYGLYKYFRQYRPITMEEHVEWFRSLHKNDKVRMFVVGLDDTIIGVCGLTSIDRVNSRAEVSCYLQFQHAHKLKDVLDTLISYAFSRENLNSVFADVFENNNEKITYFEEMTKHRARVKQTYYREGNYIDSFIFTILRDEWKQ